MERKSRAERILRFFFQPLNTLENVMSLIVAGTYDNSSKAERAVNEMLASGIERGVVCSFAVNPPGQHAGLPIGGDHHASEGAKSAGGSAAAGAGIGGAVGLGVGLATTPLLSDPPGRSPARRWAPTWARWRAR